MIGDIGALALAGVLTVGLLVVTVRNLIFIVRTGVEWSRNRKGRGQEKA